MKLVWSPYQSGWQPAGARVITLPDTAHLREPVWVRPCMGSQDREAEREAKSERGKEAGREAHAKGKGYVAAQEPLIQQASTTDVHVCLLCISGASNQAVALTKLCPSSCDMYILLPGHTKEHKRGESRSVEGWCDAHAADQVSTDLQHAGCTQQHPEHHGRLQLRQQGCMLLGPAKLQHKGKSVHAIPASPKPPCTPQQGQQ